MYLSELGYSELVQSLFEKMRFFLVDPLLTAANACIQDAPPNKMEAIQSLRALLLGEVAPLPPLAPSILPTPPVLTPMVDIDKPLII
jgi:hypothetical protein